MLAQISLVDEIHDRAIEISTRYKRAEADLIDVIQQVEDHRVFLKREHASLFSYVVGELGISESMAYSLITVARKARQVPELKARLQSGEMTLSNARRVAAVLTPQNQDEWIAKATELSGRQLEREIVKLRPQEATPECASYVSSGRVKLEVGLSEEEMIRLRRVQDLECQAQRRAVSLEEVIAVLNSEYLRRHDPVEKAKRHRVRNASPAGEAATPAPAATSTTTTETMSASASIENQTKSFNSLVALREAESPMPQTSSLESAIEQLEPETEQQSRLDSRDAIHSKPKRVPIPAAILHQVNLRDQRRCAHIKTDGTRCNQARWIEIHHKIPVSQGGLNTIDNLITLCSAHHKFAHL